MHAQLVSFWLPEQNHLSTRTCEPMLHIGYVQWFSIEKLSESLRTQEITGHWTFTMNPFFRCFGRFRPLEPLLSAFGAAQGGS